MGPRRSWLVLALGTIGVLKAQIDSQPAALIPDVPPAPPTPPLADWAAEAEWPDDHRGVFLEQATPLALASGVESCVPPSVTLSQAILETGWGRSTLATRYHNWFGIKDPGSKAEGVWLNTVEGVGVPARARFRRWSGPAGSIRAHAAILTRDARYAHAWEAWPDGPDFARAIARRWATDPEYASRLVWLIDRYALDRWDARVADASPCGDATAMADSPSD